MAERALDPARDDVAFLPSPSVKHPSQTSVIRKDGDAYVIETLEAEGRVAPHVSRRVIGEKPLWQFIVDAAGEGRGARGRFGVKLKSNDVCPLVEHDKHWEPHPISLGELIALILEYKAAMPVAPQAGFASRLRSFLRFG